MNRKPKTTRPTAGQVIRIVERHEPEPPPSAPASAVARRHSRDENSQSKRAERVRLEVVQTTGKERGEATLPALRLRASMQIRTWLAAKVECVWWEYQLLDDGSHVRVLRHGKLMSAPQDTCMTLERFPGVLNPLAIAAVEEWNRWCASAAAAVLVGSSERQAA